MDFMKYNIDFEIFGSLIMLVILLFFRLKFDRKTESEKSFVRLGYVITISQLLDMASAITISIGGPKMAVFNLLFTTGFFLSEILLGLAFLDYIFIAAYGKPSHKLRRYMIVFCAVYLVTLVLNLFLGFYFRFDFATGEYIHEKLYYVMYWVPSLLIVQAVIFILRHRKNFDLRQWLSVLSFVILVVVGLALQGTVIPEIYISFGLVTLSYLMIVFSIETPDYKKLIRTMDALEEARREAEGAKKEAERASHAKGEFLASMSHEIRTPLNAILGFDELILRENTGGEILQYASNIKRSGQTLLSLINDILDFSKIESGKMEILPVEYEIRHLITDLLLMATPRAEEKGLELRSEIDEALPVRLTGDDVRIRQVITNLLSNAVKYTETGEVLLRVSLEAPGARIRFSVRDTGVGIRPEDRQKLFDAFQRVDEERNRTIEGTGLGLAISERLLELMGSKLELESTYGAGSEFSFVLEQPVVDATPIGPYSLHEEGESRTVEITRENFTAPDVKLLVVDDMKLNLTVFVSLLKNTQMTIDTAESGAEALEKMKAGTYDLIFLDHRMPNMDGIETLKNAVAEGLVDTARTPVIALTANAISGAREIYLSEGFTDYLTKPIAIKQLMAMLMKYIPEERVRLI
ncbi:MAG: response regulator [Lachnospiraceae bacterium]|nr:response regulator [Lachnospiraceae bacterium]